MQLRYVFSETATGLKRNVSMTVALVVTIFISLTLVGMGFLLNAQANEAERTWGDKLQIIGPDALKAKMIEELQEAGRAHGAWPKDVV